MIYISQVDTCELNDFIALSGKEPANGRAFFFDDDDNMMVALTIWLA